MADAHNFRRLGGQIHKLAPVLFQFKSSAGVASGAYFHHDLLVASEIFQKNPNMHLDVGSRIDGFVALVAAFRKIYVLDIRNLSSIGHQNIIFQQHDLMREWQSEKFDSVSCLNALEQFGLGRYGDAINPDGHKTGFENLLKLLSNGGLLYLAIPIGDKSQTLFNSHRIFTPTEILSWPGNFKVDSFHYTDENGILHRDADLINLRADFEECCGIYFIVKT